MSHHWNKHTDTIGPIANPCGTPLTLSQVLVYTTVVLISPASLEITLPQTVDSYHTLSVRQKTCRGLSLLCQRNSMYCCCLKIGNSLCLPNILSLFQAYVMLIYMMNLWWLLHHIICSFLFWCKCVLVIMTKEMQIYKKCGLIESTDPYVCSWSTTKIIIFNWISC